MSTAVAALPATVALAPPSSPALDHHNQTNAAATAKAFSAIAPSSSASSNGVNAATATPQRNASAKSTSSHSPPTTHDPQLRRTTSDGKRSPQSASSRPAHIPKVIVKKEPTSPDLPTGRHRPSRLNLANSNMSNGQPSAARPSAPLTSRDQMQSAGLAIHDIGVACLSPGFNTQDPTMREQMERAMNIREQQRRLIENRQKGKTGGGPPTSETPDNAFGRPTKTPMTSRRKGPPPGLSIAAPPAEHFANERVIQSAPLHASFPRHNMNPMTRQVLNGPPQPIHHVPATQTQNRLPPIADVFPEVGQPATSSRGGIGDRGPHYQSPGRSSNQPPLPSPSYPPHTAQFPPSHHGHHALATRPREHKSAEEALKELTGGREELLPRLVHYGGHQPPTPPSPKNVGLGVSAPLHTDLHRSGSSRRRDRDEYERDNGSPPLGRQGRRAGPFGEARDSPATETRKKEEFLQLVSRAWDLWHS